MIFFLFAALSLKASLSTAILTRNWPAIYNSSSISNVDERFYFTVSLLRMREYEILYQYFSTRTGSLKKPEFFAFLYSAYNTPAGDSVFYELVERGLTRYPDLGDFLLYLRINKNIDLQRKTYIPVDLKILAKRYPESPFVERAIMQALRFMYSDGDYADYEKIFRTYRRRLKIYANRAEALYYLHNIKRFKKQKSAADSIAVRLVTRYYKSPFAYKVIRYVSGRYTFYKGLCAFYRGKYRRAIKYLRKSKLSKKYHYLTIAYYRAGYYSKLLKLYRKGLVPDSLLYYVALSYEKKRKLSKAVPLFLRVIKGSGKYRAYASYELSFIFINHPDVFKKWKRKIPHGIGSPEYLMRMGLTYMIYGEKRGAIDFFKRSLKTRDSFARAQALFWLYKISGVSAYRDSLIKAHPFSYFTWITNGEKKLPDVDSILIPMIEKNGKFLDKPDSYWDRYHIFTLLGLNNYALRSLKKCELQECVEFAYLTGADNLTVEIFKRYRKLEQGRKSLIFGFPLAYWSFIEGRTDEPFLFVSLLREESHFNHMAVSPAGAVGIAQLMPSTASRIAGRKVKLDELFDPYFNIEIGVKYLNSLLERYQGNPVFALAAYNAGEKRVDRWIKKYRSMGISADPQLFVEFIPFRETRNYVRRIMKDFRLYRMLYSHLTEELLDRKAS